MAIFLARTRPDKETDRVAWNESWEKDLAQYYSNDLSLFDTMVPMQIDLLKAEGSVYQAEILSCMKDVCDLQRRLNEVAIDQFAYSDLENVWKAYPWEKREAMVLDGLYASSCNGARENDRLWCPEMTVQLLVGDDPQWGFVNLVKRFLPVDQVPSDLVDPVLISSEKFDSKTRIPPYLANDKIVKDFVGMISMGRCQLMSMTLWAILTEISGHEVELGTYRPLIGSKEYRQAMATRDPTQQRRLDIITALLPATTQEALRNLKHNNKSEFDHARMCEHCRKTPEGAAKDGVELNLRACTSCKEIGRSIWYCSQECQKVDWKSGVPVPHKNICGKPFTEDWNLPNTPSLNSNSSTTESMADMSSSNTIKTCQSCAKKELDDSDPFTTCSKCNAIGRPVWYCSKECQLLDWKSGAPVPHKKICGKPSLAGSQTTNNRPSSSRKPAGVARPKTDHDDLYNESSPMNNLQIPPPHPSFKRPPALLHQIKDLTAKNHEYMFVNPYPQPDPAVSFISPDARLTFIMYRNQAMKTGDKAAVEGMYRMLKPFAEVYKFTRLKAQLEQEYGVTLDTEKLDRQDWRDFRWETPKLMQEWSRENPAEMLKMTRGMVEKVRELRSQAA